MDCGRFDGPSVRRTVNGLSMSARITQEVIETLQLPATHNARITQQSIEAAEIPLRSDVNARITQNSLEALEIPLRTVATSSARITQQAIEFLYIVGVNGSKTGALYFAYPVIAQVGVQ
jgi:hypothetical protein